MRPTWPWQPGATAGARSPAGPPVGLVPAAGRATRLGLTAGSKEVLPLAPAGDPRGLPPTPIEGLLAAFHRAGVREVLVVIRAGKWDIPERLGSLWTPPGPPGDPPADPLTLAYLLREESPDVLHTLDRAYPLFTGRRIALGYPDILLRPAGAFARVEARQAASGAAAVLGLFPGREPERSDMVELDARGRLRRLAVKEPDRGWRWTWGMAVFSPAFGEFLHRFVGDLDAGRRRAPAREPQVGDVLAAAVAANLAIETVAFPRGTLLDLGTPAALARARRDGCRPGGAGR